MWMQMKALGSFLPVKIQIALISAADNSRGGTSSLISSDKLSEQRVRFGVKSRFTFEFGALSFFELFYATFARPYVDKARRKRA